jgi:hypothetical protein
MKIINPITVLQDKEKFEEVFKNIEDSYRILSKTNAFPTENTYNKVMSNTFLQDTFMSFFDKTKNGKSKYENLINEKIAPALKVRNENYLHLIYGHDFMNHYQQLCFNKKINHKLDSSVLQFKLGYKMLTTQDLHERLDIFCRIQSNNKSNIDLTL